MSQAPRLRALILQVRQRVKLERGEGATGWAAPHQVG